MPTESRNTLDALLEAAQAAERSGAWDEALQRYEEAFRALPSGGGDAGAAAELLRRIGRVHRERGDIELAVEAFETSLAIAEANDLAVLRAKALNSLATARQFRGELDEAEGLYTEARSLAEEAGDLRLSAMVEQNLGILSTIRGEVAVALARYGSALERHQRTGDERQMLTILNNMAMAYVDLGEWDSAERCFTEAHVLSERVGDAMMAGKVQLNQAELYLKRQQFEQARECCDRSVEVFRRLRSKLWTGEAYKFYGVLYRDTSRSELADVHFSLALGLAQASQDPLLEAEALTEWALSDLETGRHREALQRLNRAQQLFTQLRAKRDLWLIERRLEELEPSYLVAASRWASEVVEGRDPLRKGQVARVGAYAGALASAVGVQGQELAWVRVGAYLHDIGITAVPAGVLEKPGRLTPEERQVMQSHTVIGEAMTTEMAFADDVRSMVRHHHEHWDGRGYPDGLAGDRIPVVARILTVADVYDALTTPRPYRPALSQAEALRTMKAEAGRVLDPDLYDTFRDLARDGALEVRAA